MARLFVAVRPPDDVLRAAEEAVAAARRSMVGPRWTTPAQWHLTLAFLGWVEDVEAAASALVEVRRLAPFTVRMGGGGAFPSPRRGRVVWLGTVEGAEALGRMAGAVAEALAPVGFVPEARPFHAHLTLARLKTPADVVPAVEALGAGPVGASFTVREVVLYQSTLRREGAVYEALAQVPLEG